MMHEHEIDQIERVVTAALYRNDCPPSMTLGEYKRGFLAGDAAAQIADHLAFCTHCQADAVVLTTFSAMIAREVDEEVVSVPAVSSAWKLATGYRWQRVKETGKLVIQLVDSALAPSDNRPLLGAVKSGRSLSSDTLRNITLTSGETGDVDVSAVVIADPADPTLCSLRVRVQIPDRWPDLAGIQIYVEADDWAEEQTTNGQGEVLFDGVTARNLDLLSITITQPNQGASQ